MKLWRLVRAFIATSEETAWVWSLLASTIHGCLRACSADGLLFWSRVNRDVMKSLAYSEIVAQTGSAKENLPLLTFFMIS